MAVQTAVMRYAQVSRNADDDDDYVYNVVAPDAVTILHLVRLDNLVRIALDHLDVAKHYRVARSEDGTTFKVWGANLIRDAMIGTMSTPQAGAPRISDAARVRLRDDVAAITEEQLALWSFVQTAIRGYVHRHTPPPFGPLVKHIEDVVLYRSECYDNTPNILPAVHDPTSERRRALADEGWLPHQPAVRVPWADFVCMIGEAIEDKHGRWIKDYIDRNVGRLTLDLAVARYSDSNVFVDNEKNRYKWVARSARKDARRAMQRRWAGVASNDLRGCIGVPVGPLHPPVLVNHPGDVWPVEPYGLPRALLERINAASLALRAAACPDSASAEEKAAAAWHRAVLAAEQEAGASYAPVSPRVE